MSDIQKLVQELNDEAEQHCVSTGQGFPSTEVEEERALMALLNKAADEIIRLDRALHYEQNDVPGIERQLYREAKAELDEAKAELDAAWQALGEAQAPGTDHIYDSIRQLYEDRDAERELSTELEADRIELQAKVGHLEQLLKNEE